MTHLTTYSRQDALEAIKRLERELGIIETQHYNYLIKAVSEGHIAPKDVCQIINNLIQLEKRSSPQY